MRSGFERFEFHYDLPHPLRGVYEVIGDYCSDDNSVHIDLVKVDGANVTDAFDLDYLVEQVLLEYAECL